MSFIPNRPHPVADARAHFLAVAAAGQVGDPYELVLLAGQVLGGLVYPKSCHFGQNLKCIQ